MAAATRPPGSQVPCEQEAEEAREKMYSMQGMTLLKRAYAGEEGGAEEQRVEGKTHKGC